MKNAAKICCVKLILFVSSCDHIITWRQFNIQFFGKHSLCIIAISGYKKNQLNTGVFAVTRYVMTSRCNCVFDQVFFFKSDCNAIDIKFITLKLRPLWQVIDNFWIARVDWDRDALSSTMRYLKIHWGPMSNNPASGQVP